MIKENFVLLDFEAENRLQVIEELAERFYEMGKLDNKGDFIQAVLDREKQFSTCFDFEVAIPHGKTDAVREATLGFSRVKTPIKWCEDSPNNAKLIFLIGVPESDKNDTHLKILAKLSRNIMHDDFRKKLLNCETENEVVETLSKVLND